MTKLKLLTVFLEPGRVLLVAGIALGLLTVPMLDAAAQIPKAEQNCVNALNKAGWKLARTQAKQLQVCIQSYLRGGPSADLCAPTDPKGRITRAQQRTMNEFQRKCSVLPGFGPQDPNQVNAASRQKEFELYARVFGSSLDQLATHANDPLESRCIQLIAKSLAKCEDAKLKEFVKCKKAGLKDLSDPIESALELQDRCLGTGSEQQPDPLNKIQRKCTDPDRGFIFKYMRKSCVEKSVDLVSAFGNGVCAAEAAVDGPTLAACIEREVECAVCLWANATDGLSRDCDLFDNGLTDGSCGAICGNSIVEGSEDCDGTSDAACPGECRSDCSCPAVPCPDCCATGLDLLSFTTTVPSGNSGVLRNFRCHGPVGNPHRDFASYACAHDGDGSECNLGPCTNLGPVSKCLDEPGYPSSDPNTGIVCTTDADCIGVCEEADVGLYPDLEAGRLYVGSGQSSFRELKIPDQAQSFTRLTGCANNELTLGPTTPGEVDERHCTTGRKCSGSATPCVLDDDCPSGETCDTLCLFGAPAPKPNPDSPDISVCLVNHVAENASGSAGCDGSVSGLSLPLRTMIYLMGDICSVSTPPDIPGTQACPLCDTVCQGGSKHRFPCVDDTDCPEGSCGLSPQCLGGPNDGNPCTPETSGTAELGDGFPTSHDCPPDPDQDLTLFSGGIPLAVSLTTGSITLNARDNGEWRRNFFGFCRDWHWPWVCDGRWEGDPSCGGDGVGVPCNDDSDCDEDDYESCVQGNPGAFFSAAATHIEVNGSTDGQCLTDGQPHTTELVSVFPIPPTFDATFDNLYRLPGPGALLLQGEQQLQ